MKLSTYNIGLSSVRTFIFGKEKPALLRRILCWSGLLLFLWYFLWYLVNLIALQMIDTMPNAEHLREVFLKIGERFQSTDIMGSCFRMALVGLISSLVLFLSLVFLWRNYRIAYSFFFLSLLTCLISPALFIGVEYLWLEEDWWEYFIPGAVLIYALIENYLSSRII